MIEKMLKGKVKQKRTEKTKMIFVELIFYVRKVKGEKRTNKEFQKTVQN